MSASALDVFKNLSPEQQEALAQRALASQPAAYVSLFMNQRRREGKQDAHYTGRMDISCAVVEAALAEARAKGWANLQYHLDVWVQHDGSGDGPILSGRAKNKVADDKRFTPTRQPSGPAIGKIAEEGDPDDHQEEPGTDDDCPF